MKRCFLLSLAVLLPSIAFANTFEADGTPEREPFSYTKTTGESTNVSDPVDDLVIFDKQSRNTEPTVLADLTSVRFDQQDTNWLVTFTTKDPLPEDPNLSVNFDVFIDADGDDSNNATTGVYRVGADTIFMILHGTRTKWHSKWWKYNPATGRWTEQSIDPQYTIGTDTFSISIPYEVVPKQDNIEMYGFSLTSDKGITAIDVAPGVGLPSVRNKVNKDIVLEPTENTDTTKPKNSYWVFFVILAMLLVGTLYMANRKK